MRDWAPAFAAVMVMLLLTLMLFVAPAHAQTFPKLSGRVVDDAHLLSASQKSDLDSKLRALEAGSGRQLVVATIPSLEGRTIEDYGYRLGRTWAIGQKGKDDGVILLVAPAEHKVRIETGYGARVFVTDAVSSVIVRDSILPRFTAGDMGGGIVAGADQLIQFMSLPPAEMQKRAAAVGEQEKQRAGGQGVPLVPIIFWIIIILFVIMPLVRRASGNRYRRGGLSAPVILWGPGLGGSGSSGSSG
ncbi:MAG: TPM domain-containing protein, partial [Pseudomonadota bacterium]|nr:TPM domain-containing protein [Pseudomonadota bacterium]